MNALVQLGGQVCTAMRPVPPVTMGKDVVFRAGVLMEQTVTVSPGHVSVPRATW